MSPTLLAISRRWATIAIFVAVAIAGVVSYSALPINQFPKVNIPVVTVTTVYPGANPLEIETQITRPIEDAVAGLNSIDNITSTSGESFSTVTITFTDAADPNLIGSDVERQVNAVVSQFPTGANRPVVLKVDFTQLPVMLLAVVDDTLEPERLYDVAHDLLPSIRRVNGVSQVELIGGRQREVRVEVDPTRLAAYGVSLSQIQAALAAANTSLPGGGISQGSQQYSLQVSGLLAQPEDLASVFVTGTGTQQVRVGDVATVIVGATAQTQVTRVNGHPAIQIAVGQQNGSNLTDVTGGITRALPHLRSLLSSSSQLIVVQDTTPFVRRSLDGIQHELTTAVILTSVVLLAFLHNPRAAIIVLVSIPTTLLTTFIAMRLMGFSLNFLSTLGLTLTVGILVDDSIVVLENILRHLGRGAKPFDAALRGRAEIGLAAVAITLVDVVVFVPTGLVSGQIGSFFREFGFTVAAATLVSLAVSFTLTPMLASLFLKPESHAVGRGPLARYGRWWDVGFGRLEAGYRRLLGWALQWWGVVLGVAALTVVLGLALLATGRVPTEFVPSTDNGSFSVNTTAPPGTSLAAHDAAMRSIEGILLELPEVETVAASVGVSSAGFFGSGSSGQARFGSATVQLHPRDSGRRDVFAVVEDARARLSSIPGVQIRVSATGGGGPPGQAIAVRLTGPDLAVLTQLADQLGQSMENAPGLVNVANGAPAGQPMLLVRVDQSRAADLGVNALSLGTAVRTAYSGIVATKYQKPDGTLDDVRLRLSPEARSQIASVGDLPIQTSTGQTVRLSSIATIEETSGPTQISRRDRERVVNVTADLDTGTTLGQVQPGLQRAVAALAIPPGYTATLGGNSEQQTKSFGQLLAALGASVMLAYLLMAVLYNSLVHPLVILFSLPAAIGGAFFSLFAFGYAFSIFSMIGLILLVGLAIKNGILLVDRTNRNREAGMDTRAALLDAGPARLRPILMTSTTIAVALFPTALKLGEGAEQRAPLAATVLGGVISSTLLTLVLVPVMYTLLEGLLGRVRWVGSAVTRLIRRQRIVGPPERGDGHSNGRHVEGDGHASRGEDAPRSDGAQVGHREPVLRKQP